MTQTLSVLYDGEVFRPDKPLNLKPNKHYLVIIQEIPISSDKHFVQADFRALLLQEN